MKDNLGASPSEAATNEELIEAVSDPAIVQLLREEIGSEVEDHAWIPGSIKRLEKDGGSPAAIERQRQWYEQSGDRSARYSRVIKAIEALELARTSSSGPPNERCNSRQPPGGEDVRCELRAGHGVIHLCGEYCWPMARKCVVCQKPAPDEADFCSTKCEDIARRETDIEKSYPASSSGQGSTPDK